MYDLEINPPLQVPNFITLDPNGIKVRTEYNVDFTSPEVFEDEYEITLVVKANGPSVIPDGMEEAVVYTLKVSACKIAKISFEDGIQDFTYNIRSGPSDPLGGNFVFDDRCAMECSLVVDYPDGRDSNADPPFTFEQADCLVTVDTDYSGYHNKRAVFMLKGTITESGNDATQVFTVSF
jgi:hypothetical protein